MNPSAIPDVAIIGLPKCGSSSLFYWLSQSPDIAPSSPKEPFYFMDSDHPLYSRRLENQKKGEAGNSYLCHYNSTHLKEHRLKLESTTHYFYQKTAREALTKPDNNNKIIILLREPAKRILSSFLYTKNNVSAISKKLSFNYYVDLLISNEAEKLNEYYHIPSSLYIAKKQLELSKYTYWIDWWKEKLDERRVKIITFDELTKNSKPTLKEICSYINLNDSFIQTLDFKHYNKTTKITNPFLHRKLRSITKHFPRNRLKQNLVSFYNKLQTLNPSKEEDTTEGLSRLREHLKEEAISLKQKYGIEFET